MKTNLSILVLINAHSVAHVTRPLEIAKVLRAEGHMITFAGHGKYLEIASMEGFDTHKLSGLSTERMRAIMQTGKLGKLYPIEEIRSWIEEEIQLIQRLNANLIISDNRITASTSAELTNTKMVSIINAHMTMYRKIPFFSYSRLFKFKINALAETLDKLENKLEFQMWNHFVSADLNLIRKELGLKPKYSYLIDEGNLNLIPDIPEFNPMISHPENVKYVGPLTWNSSLPAPECLNKLDRTKKIIYFSVGSEGLIDLIGSLSTVFVQSQYQIVISTGGVELPNDLKIPDNIFIEKYVNADTLLPLCDLVVCHGGNGTIYQALAQGVPVLGIATHAEQFYGIKRLMDLKLGLGITKKDLLKKGNSHLNTMALKILTNLQYSENVAKMSEAIKKWNGPNLAAQLILDFLNASRKDSYPVAEDFAGL